LAKLGLRCHEFVHTVSAAERETVLEQFEDGLIEVLVAIRCLDEGVDVPATQTAFFLASSMNPRQFVQRRGRVLRLSEGKEQAVIYDFLVVPESDVSDMNRDTGLSLLRREMPRFAEFSSAAKNAFAAALTSSAVGKDVTSIGVPAARGCSYTSRSVASTCTEVVPRTIRSGCRVSSTANPSRRNSGVHASSAPTPIGASSTARAEARGQGVNHRVDVGHIRCH